MTSNEFAAPAGYRIKILADGPYLVLGGVPLVRRYPAMSTFGEPLEWDPVGVPEEEISAGPRYTLCRCGLSVNKPFCDGKHVGGGFQGALAPDRRPSASRQQVWRAHGLELTDDRALCAGAGFCRTRLTGVWEMLPLSDDPEVRARLLRMVTNCPSGRLTITLAEGGLLEPAYRPSIAVIRDGPLWVRGGIPIEAPDGFVYERRQRVTLCRCGHSKNMPFCDETHAENGFRAE